MWFSSVVTAVDMHAGTLSVHIDGDPEGEELHGLRPDQIRKVAYMSYVYVYVYRYMYV